MPDSPIADSLLNAQVPMPWAIKRNDGTTFVEFSEVSGVAKMKIFNDGGTKTLTIHDDGTID